MMSEELVLHMGGGNKKKEIESLPHTIHKNTFQMEVKS